MPKDIKIWEIAEGDALKEFETSKLNSEKRLEDWIEKDISIVSDNLLLIGRQVQTDFGGGIDLLCLDSDGDLVIVELKRDKTPREITAQVLDYASWVKDLFSDKINEIADKHFGKENSLEEKFREKFGTDIPEVLNENHKMLIVASEIDSQSERIIEYLSDSHGIGINAVTFQFFQKESKEFLSRVFLIDPGEAEYRTRTRSASKRKSALTYEELEKIAEKNKVGDLYRKIVEELTRYFDQRVTTRSSVAFIGIMGENKSRKTIFSILPEKSSSGTGIQYEVYLDRFVDYFGINKEVVDVLSSYKRESDREGREFGKGYFKNEDQINKFLKQLAKIKKVK